LITTEHCGTDNKQKWRPYLFE